jgi:hypothetical protein
MSRSSDQLGILPVGTIRTTPVNAPYNVGTPRGKTLVTSAFGVGMLARNVNAVVNNNGTLCIIQPGFLGNLTGPAEGSFSLTTVPFDFGIAQNKILSGIVVSHNNLVGLDIEVYRKFSGFTSFDLIGVVSLGMNPTCSLYIAGQSFKLKFSGKAIDRDKSIFISYGVLWKDSDKRGVYGNTYAPNMFKN